MKKFDEEKGCKQLVGVDSFTLIYGNFYFVSVPKTAFNETSCFKIPEWVS